MPEILSQNQIDELLNELMGNDAEKEIAAEENAKPYNFKTPKALPRSAEGADRYT